MICFFLQALLPNKAEGSGAPTSQTETNSSSKKIPAKSSGEKRTTTASANAKSS